MLVTKMPFDEVRIDDLIINRANDRHGELENETGAIAWLFNQKELHMKNLARDVVAQAQVFEPPLVSPERDKFIVFDGNRRVTCMKLLSKPSRAPTAELQQFFDTLRATWNGDFPGSLTCQIETDRDRIDDILFRRHTGSQSGVGQSTWDDRMKSNFVNRTGRGSGVNVAEEIEKLLMQTGMLPLNKKIPRANLNRLLSAEAFRNRVGISLRNGKIEYTHEIPYVLTALQRITNDLAHRRKVLGDIWDVRGKTAYLDELFEEGVLPSPETRLTAGVQQQETLGAGSQRSRVSPISKARSGRRNTLIPNAPFGILWTGRLQRQREIWEELQFRLRLSEHPNAIAVLLRVLIELSIDNYVAQKSLNTVHDGDKLSKKAEKVAADLKETGKIDDKYLGAVKKFQQAEILISADTLNRYIHSSQFSPSPEHLTAIWDTLSELIVHCLNA